MIDFEMPKLLSVAETARALRVHPETIRNMVTAGSLDAIRVGEKIIRIREADVASLLKGKGVAK